MNASSPIQLPAVRRIALLLIVFAAPLLLSAASHELWRAKGHAVSIAYDRAGVLHIVYVDDANRVVHVSGNRKTLVSPAGTRPDAHGEVTPLIVARDAGTLFVIYSEKVDAKWATRLVAARSSDGGRTWSAPFAVNDDRASASHSFADAVAAKNGVVVSWLDNRTGHQGVRSALVGASRVSTNTSVDSMTCECCRTALLRANDGAVWLAYRDHAAGDVRNMAYAISRDGGATFKTEGDIANDNWSLKGCPDSGPRLTQSSDGTVWAAWFNGAAPAIEIASNRSGKFNAPERIAAPDARYTMVIHPDIGTLADGRLIVVYEATRRDGVPVILARVGNASPAVIAEHASTPRFARSGARATIAYSEHMGNEESVVVRSF